MSSLSLEIVTPHGRVLAENDVVRVLVRRFESRFETGSQVVFLPHHGSETVHLGEGILEYWHAQGGPISVRVRGGFAEIDRDCVTVLTPDAQVL